MLFDTRYFYAYILPMIGTAFAPKGKEIKTKNWRDSPISAALKYLSMCLF